MGDFRKELEEHTKEIHEIGNSTLSGKEKAEKINEYFKGLSPKQIAKKIEKSAENEPKQLKVKNLTKARAQEQSLDKDEIE